MSLIDKVYSLNPKNFSYGSTAAIITNLGLIIGLNSANSDKLSIIGSLIILAVADNMSDAIGIHVYQDSQNTSSRNAWIMTFTNFITRFGLSLVFILFILLLPIKIAIYLSIIIGLFILSLVSYLIGINRKLNPWKLVIEHLVIGSFVIVFSRYLGSWITNVLKI